MSVNGLRVEHAWLSDLAGKLTLRAVRGGGEGQWDWLFVSAPHHSHVWVYRIRTTGGGQLLPIRETCTRLKEGDEEIVIRAGEAAFDRFDPCETKLWDKCVDATATVQGLLLPVRAGGDAHFLTEDPRSFTRYWLEYEPDRKSVV